MRRGSWQTRSIADGDLTTGHLDGIYCERLIRWAHVMARLGAMYSCLQECCKTGVQLFANAERRGWDENFDGEIAAFVNAEKESCLAASSAVLSLVGMVLRWPMASRMFAEVTNFNIGRTWTQCLCKVCGECEK